MASEHYRKNIREYITALPQEALVTTDMVTAYMAGKTGAPSDKVRKAVNVNLARLVTDGTISRVTRGMYCRRIETPFGDYIPSKDAVFSKRLVADGDDVIGYETGLSLMNQIGLVSLMPKKRTIATNRYGQPVPKGVDFSVRKPRTHVSRENFKYLQILDVIDDMDDAPIDASEPESIIREKVETAGLLPERLILYARKFYSAKTLGKTVDIVLGGIHL